MTDSTAAIRTDSTSTKGIGYLVFGLSIFAFQDVLIRLLSGSYPVHEIVFVRGVVGLIPALLIIRLEGGWYLLKTRRPVMQGLRASLMFLSYSTYYLALTALPLADAVTLFYSCPLFVTALAVPFLGERVGFRRWLAVLVGFGGIIVVTRPAGEGFDPAMILAVASALTYAMSSIMTRKLSTTEAGSTLAFYTTLVYILASATIGAAIGDGSLAVGDHPSSQFLLRAWVLPNLHDFGLMALCGVISGVGFYCLSQAYRLGSASTVAPFEYSSLPWAILWGYLFWAEVPGPTTIIGLTLVVGSGLYIIHRESVRGRRVVQGRTFRHKI